MRITVLSSLPPLKGISKYTASFLGGIEGRCNVEALSFKRMYPERLYPGGTKDESMKPIDLQNVRERAFLTWYNPFGWIYAGFSLRGDIVHAQWWSYVLAPVYLTILSIAKYLRRKKIVITVHNITPHEEGMIQSIANKSVLKLADHFIVHSEGNKQVFTKSHSVARQKVSVIPHGVLMPDTPISDMSMSSARSKLGLPASAKVVLFFGIIREYKGLDTLLEAFARVYAQTPQARLVIAGKPWEGWEKYQKIIDKHNMQQAVISKLEFIPEEEIEMYFKAADIVTLPYKGFDSQSGAGSLALPFGKPVLVTNVGGLPELVRDKESVTEPADPVEMSEKINRILTNHKLSKKLADDSLNLAKALSWDSIGEKTLKLYKRLSE